MSIKLRRRFGPWCRIVVSFPARRDRWCGPEQARCPAESTPTESREFVFGSHRKNFSSRKTLSTRWVPEDRVLRDYETATWRPRSGRAVAGRETSRQVWRSPTPADRASSSERQTPARPPRHDELGEASLDEAFDALSQRGQ